MFTAEQGVGIVENAIRYTHLSCQSENDQAGWKTRTVDIVTEISSYFAVHIRILRLSLD